MRAKIAAWVGFFVLLISTPVWASQEAERTYLIQILNQLDAMRPLVIAAAQEQPTTNRMQFHYTAFKGNNGKQHQGLLEDINAIEQGIRQKLSSAIEPRMFQPIQGDYMSHTTKNNTAP